MQGKLLLGQKRREMCNKGIVRGGGRRVCVPFYITGTVSSALEVVSRWNGCFMPKMKCLSALVLVTGRASLFVEVKNLFLTK